MIVAGYSINKSMDTYRIYNPKTWKIVKSRDVQWGEWKAGETKALNTQDNVGTDRDDDDFYACYIT